MMICNGDIMGMILQVCFRTFLILAWGQTSPKSCLFRLTGRQQTQVLPQSFIQLQEPRGLKSHPAGCFHPPSSSTPGIPIAAEIIRAEWWTGQSLCLLRFFGPPLFGSFWKFHFFNVVLALLDRLKTKRRIPMRLDGTWWNPLFYISIFSLFRSMFMIA